MVKLRLPEITGTSFDENDNPVESVINYIPSVYNIVSVAGKTAGEVMSADKVCQALLSLNGDNTLLLEDLDFNFLKSVLIPRDGYPPGATIPSHFAPLLESILESEKVEVQEVEDTDN